MILVTLHICKLVYENYSVNVNGIDTCTHVACDMCNVCVYVYRLILAVWEWLVHSPGAKKELAELSFVSRERRDAEPK